MLGPPFPLENHRFDYTDKCLNNLWTSGARLRGGKKLRGGKMKMFKRLD